MDIEKAEDEYLCVRFSVIKNSEEVGRARLYVLENDLHRGKMFGLMEDVFINEDYRGEGIGSELVREIIQEARDRNCYKLICTSRYENKKVHMMYEGLGFRDHGKEFRINFNK